MKTRRRRAERGMTLIEIMVVLVIIGLIASAVAVNVVGRLGEAKVKQAETDVRSIASQGVDAFKVMRGRYPTTEQGLQALITKPSTEPIPNNWKQGGYLERSSVPRDPWGQPYQYLNPGLRGEIDVFSFGADGQPGGEGENADLVNP